MVLLERPSFVFYAPDLAPRVEPQVRPALAAAYFVHPERTWLITPSDVRTLAGWQQIQKWMEHFPPVDLSADAALSLFYVGQISRDTLLSEVAYFDLPTASLARGTLLLDLLLKVGPIPVVLWKVDQVALSRGIDIRNPALLPAVSFLAANGHGDRAASLAYRLATAAPDWPEAQQALAAFQPSRP